MSAITIYVFLGIAAWLYWKWWNSKSAKAGRIVESWSGPKGLPVVGNAFQVPTDLIALVKKLQEWGREYSSPMRLQMGPLPVVHLFEPQHIECLLKSNKNLRKPREYDYAKPWLGEGLAITSDIPSWSHRRKLLTNAFHFQILRDISPIFQEHALDLVDVLRSNINGNGPIDVAPFINLAALDTICDAAMGKKLGALRNSNSDYINALHRTAEIQSGRMWNVLQWNDTVYSFSATHREEQSLIKTLHDFTKQVVVERAKKDEESAKKVEKKDIEFGEKKKRMAFLDLMMEVREEGGLSLDEIRVEVDTFMFAGHDTTGVTLMWFVHILGVHPGIQDKLREEIRNVLGPDPTVIPKPDDLSKLVYLERCFKETLRLFPTVPITARFIDEPVVLDSEHTIPAGITVWTNYFALHHNPKYWPEPLKYDPDRFLPENSEGRHPFAFLPFSAGQRNCLGMKFAQTEVKNVMVNLLRNFSWTSLHKPEEMQQSISLLINRPENGVWVVLKFINFAEEE